MIHLRPRNPHAKAGLEPHFHAWHRYVVMELNFGLVTPPALAQDRCSFSAIGAPNQPYPEHFSLVQSAKSTRGIGPKESPISPHGGGSIARPLLSRKAARVDRLRLHTQANTQGRLGSHLSLSFTPNAKKPWPCPASPSSVGI